MRLRLHLERVVAHGARVHIPVRSDAELEFVFILECIPVMLNPRSTLDVRCSSLAGLANSNTTARALDLVARCLIGLWRGVSVFNLVGVPMRAYLYLVKLCIIPDMEPYGQSPSRVGK